MKAIEASRSRPLLLITFTFIASKALLWLVAYGCPGIGYDTSASLLEDYDFAPKLLETPSKLQHSLTKFVRWDAIYFTQIAARHYVFEQEWAFSFVFSKMVSAASEVIPHYLDLSHFQAITLSGLLVSHLAHISSAYVLYFLTKRIYVELVPAKHIALGAAILHIISPAGLFLSAPYTESLFSFLNISGFALYLNGMNRRHSHATTSSRLQVITAGLVFGLSTSIRSNGLLSGLLFLFDTVARIWAIVNHGFNSRRLYDLGSLITGGLLVACGFTIPQTVAYWMYCVDDIAGTRQPWCTRTIPSIYTWVQEHYWVNGLFRYWTFSNLPLFLLAAPMLCILSYTAIRTLWPDCTSKKPVSPGKGAKMKASKLDEGALVRLALPQLALAVLAFFFNNVQIITRLSSGYPLWYIWLAQHIFDSNDFGQESNSFITSSHVVRFMVMYAVVQGGLYASFLPPA